MKITAAIKNDGKWNIFRCVVRNMTEAEDEAKKKFKNIQRTVILDIEAGEVVNI